MKKYDATVEIDLPTARVIELFDNPDNLGKWLKELDSFDHLEGEAGQQGAKSSLKMTMGKRSCELIETIKVRDLPRELTCTYETKGMFNECKNVFEDLGGTRTRWTQTNEFVTQGIMMKIITILMPGAFKKQTLVHMNNFKVQSSFPE